MSSTEHWISPGPGQPPGPLRVVGIDASLTSTGLSDGYRHRALLTCSAACLEERVDAIVRGTVQFLLEGPRSGADLVVIEGPAFSRQAHPGHEELSGVRVLLRHRLWRMKIPFAVVAPTTLKRYVTGYGKASKQMMTEVVSSRYGAFLEGVKVSRGRHDMADALGLAAMGYEHLGQPLGDDISETGDPALVCPAGSPVSLDAVQWPELLSL